MVQSGVRCEDLHFTDSEETGRRTPALRVSHTGAEVNAAPAHPRHPLICHLENPKY